MFYLLNLKFLSSANVEDREMALKFLSSANVEDRQMAQKLIPNQLYYFRSSHGLKYVSFQELSENGYPTVFDVNRYGAQTGEPYEFLYPERLIGVKR